MTDREMAYVQMSRHRKTLQIYTDEHEAGIALTNLAREHLSEGRKLKPRRGQDSEHSPLLSQIETSHAKHMAHDLGPTVQQNRPQREPRK